jgi:nucleotide-binding universal stress UspA family protein
LVFIYRRFGDAMPYRVVVPHDYGPDADAALAWAGSLLRSTGGTLVLLHVILVPAPPIKRVPMIPELRPTEDPDVSVEKLRAVAEKHSQPAEIDICAMKDAGPGIVERAQYLGADLIALGAQARGRGGLSRAILGSVVDYVVWHAHCPVVAVRTGLAAPPSASRLPI